MTVEYGIIYNAWYMIVVSHYYQGSCLFFFEMQIYDIQVQYNCIKAYLFHHGSPMNRGHDMISYTM